MMKHVIQVVHVKYHKKTVRMIHQFVVYEMVHVLLLEILNVVLSVWMHDVEMGC